MIFIIFFELSVLSNTIFVVSSVQFSKCSVPSIPCSCGLIFASRSTFWVRNSRNPWKL